MSERTLKRVGRFLTEHTLFQWILSVPFSYFVGLAVDVKNGSVAVFDSLPTLFWPILMGVVLLITVYPGFLSPIVRWRRRTKRKRTEEIQHAYMCVSRIYKPEMLDPGNPGNHEAMKELAQLPVDALRIKLFQNRRIREDIPPMIDVDNKQSIRQWYEVLRHLRAANP